LGAGRLLFHGPARIGWRLDHEIAKGREGTKHEDHEARPATSRSSRFACFVHLRAFAIQTLTAPV
jgi:hypothetical protein